jgi:hypothetical protein
VVEVNRKGGSKHEGRGLRIRGKQRGEIPVYCALIWWYFYTEKRG